jgi:hypothetical protein
MAAAGGAIGRGCATAAGGCTDVGGDGGTVVGGAIARGGIAVCGVAGRCAGATCAGGAGRVRPGAMRTLGAGWALTVGGTGRRSRCGSGAMVAGGVPA